MYTNSDPRRPDKLHKYKHTVYLSSLKEDLTSDYMSIFGMIFSMTGLMMRIKWCGWVALYCTCISYANCRFNYDNKQMISFFILSLSSIVMTYLQNPQPMTPPWENENE